MRLTKNHRLFAIGASAGGINAVKKCIDGFNGGEDAAFVVVLHSARESDHNNIVEYLNKTIKMPVSLAKNLENIEVGHVYLSSPDRHLLIEDHAFLLSNGPRENFFRPAIDVLFRSAAIDFGNRAIGVLLTGRLNDGAIGLSAIKRCGGITIVQDPQSAEFVDMPLYAKKTVDPDYILPLEQMPRVFGQLLENPLPEEKEIPVQLIREVEIIKNVGKVLEQGESNEHNLSCPDCGGPLSKAEDQNSEHYRCKLGHSYNLASLEESQSHKMEESLWVAIRILDERRVLLKKMISDYERKGMEYLTRSTTEKLSEVEKHVYLLKGAMGLNGG